MIYCTDPLRFEGGNGFAPGFALTNTPTTTSFWVDALGRQALSHTELQALAVRACEEVVCTIPNIPEHNVAPFMVQRDADKWFARRRPLAHWAVNVLISHDLTTSILLQCDDAITLSRLARVCRGWAAPELQLGLDAAWRTLAQPLFAELSWKRRYQLLSQTLAQNVPQPSPTCKSLRESRERSALTHLDDRYTFSCIACDAVTGVVLFCVHLETDQRDLWPGRGGFQLACSYDDALYEAENPGTEVAPVLPPAFSRQDAALSPTQTCPAGQMRIKILVLRGSDLKVTQLAEFELDMSSYGGSDYGGGDPGQDPTLFYDHDPILIPPLWCPDLEERKHTRISIDLWAGPAEGAKGAVAADAGAAAPPQQSLSWRLHRMGLMFTWGHGGATAEKLAAVRTAEQGVGLVTANLKSFPISCTEVLAVLERVGLKRRADPETQQKAPQLFMFIIMISAHASRTPHRSRVGAAGGGTARATHRTPELAEAGHTFGHTCTISTEFTAFYSVYLRASPLHQHATPRSPSALSSNYYQCERPKGRFAAASRAQVAPCARAAPPAVRAAPPTHTARAAPPGRAAAGNWAAAAALRGRKRAGASWPRPRRRGRATPRGLA